MARGTIDYDALVDACENRMTAACVRGDFDAAESASDERRELMSASLAQSFKDLQSFGALLATVEEVSGSGHAADALEMWFDIED